MASATTSIAAAAPIAAAAASTAPGSGAGGISAILRAAQPRRVRAGLVEERVLAHVPQVWGEDSEVPHLGQDPASAAGQHYAEEHRCQDNGG